MIPIYYLISVAIAVGIVLLFVGLAYRFACTISPVDEEEPETEECQHMHKLKQPHI